MASLRLARNASRLAPANSHASSQVRPTDVRITTEPRPLAAGQVAEFSCVATGSRPAAKIFWSMRRAGGQVRPLEPGSWRQLVGGQNNISLSRLTLQLEREDHQAQLSCRAENEQLNKLRQIDAQPTGNAPEDSRTLTVHCKFGCEKN